MQKTFEIRYLIFYFGESLHEEPEEQEEQQIHYLCHFHLVISGRRHLKEK